MPKLWILLGFFDQGRADVVGNGSVGLYSIVGLLVLVNGGRNVCRAGLAGVFVKVDGGSLTSLRLAGDDLVLASENELATGGHSNACLVRRRLVRRPRDVLSFRGTLLVRVVLVVGVLFSV